jgi:hypothetical protein
MRGRCRDMVIKYCVIDIDIGTERYDQGIGCPVKYNLAVHRGVVRNMLECIKMWKYALCGHGNMIHNPYLC